MIKLVGIYTSTLGLASKVCGISKHFGQWNESTYDLHISSRFHTFDSATSGVQVSDDVSHVIFRYGDLDFEDRLQDHWIRFFAAIFESHGSCNFKCHLRGVDIVVGSVYQSGSEVQYRIPGKYAIYHGFPDSLIDRCNKFFRYGSTDDLVDKFISFTWLS